MQKIAVVLSGCGVFDGAEINEVVLTLLAIEQAGLAYQALAPNIAQTQVIDHAHEKPSQETRNVLVEAARIVRGNIIDLAEANPADYAALIVPGGFGAAQNLCNFASQGENMTIIPEFLRFAQAFHQAGKPQGYICIAPVMIPTICGKGARATIGNAKEIANKVEALGGNHIPCMVDDIVIDDEHNIVSTPAYMLAHSISEAQMGINKLVKQVASRL